MKIDFVIPWVDGSDPAWQEEFKRYSPDPASCDARFERYRDWDLMRYWFRCVEQNAPWVNKIYFITWGHVPEWLNVNHPKLVIVKHEDYIPKEYLPTFSSHPIELNIHRIDGLSEHFVYFNDDIFLIDKVTQEDFFVNGLPCDMAVENVISTDVPVWGAILSNNISNINRLFEKRDVYKKHLSKWMSLKYGLGVIRNLLLLPWGKFCGIYAHHLPQPFRKSTFIKIWSVNHNLLDSVSKNKFRTFSDVNQYFISSWSLCDGDFHPYNKLNQGTLFTVNNDNVESICEFIKNKEMKIVVINDDEKDSCSFDKNKERLCDSFLFSFQKKSEFER